MTCASFVKADARLGALFVGSAASRLGVPERSPNAADFQRSRHGTARVDWSDYTLLRDNVQHYLESGPGQPRYEVLHEVERAVDGEPSQVNAIALRRELQRAWAALAGLTLAQSAVSLRTRALLTGCDRAPPVRGTVVAKLTGWSLPLVADEAQPLQAHLAAFVHALLAITDSAAPTDDVYVAQTEGLGEHYDA